MTRAEILERARSAINRGTTYGLGKGGRDPLAELPGKNGLCDCSGFAPAWCCGISRYQPDDPFYKRYNGGWLETTAIVADATRKKRVGGFFFAVPAPEPGDLVVYGDRVVGGRKRQGHIGVVETFDPVLFWDGLTVIDCSSSNTRKFGDAIASRWGEFFGRQRAIFVRFSP